MAENAKAIGYLELNSKQFEDAIDLAKKALVGLSAAFAAVKTVDFWKEGIEGAIKFGNEVYFAAQKLNGYDPGKLFIVQKALQAGGLAAEEARGKIEEFGIAGRPLEQLFKAGRTGFGDALVRATKEYGTQAAILSSSAEKFAYVQGQLNAISTKLQGFFLGLGDKIIEPLSNLLSEIDKIDLVNMGEKFGAYITDAINIIRGLISNKDLLRGFSLALKVGLEIAVDFLLQPKFWSGIAKIAIGALAVIGNFLTTIFLNVGKILEATLQTALARFAERSSAFIGRISPGAQGALEGVITGGISTDFAKNLANIENNNLIQAQGEGAKALNSEALATAMSGVNDFLRAGGRVNLSSSDQRQLQEIIAKAIQSGRSLSTPVGTKNALFSETADPIHVIADSLARVGGGGRYVRTGLSIAEKAALDSLRFQKQVADNTKIIAEAAKNNKGTSRIGSVMIGG